VGEASPKTSSRQARASDNNKSVLDIIFQDTRTCAKLTPILCRASDTGNPRYTYCQKHTPKCLEVLKKYLGVHLDVLCSLTKFREKYFGRLSKKGNFRCSKIAIYVTFFSPFYICHKKYLLSAKLCR
jgi:hypothetical protein